MISTDRRNAPIQTISIDLAKVALASESNPGTIARLLYTQDHLLLARLEMGGRVAEIAAQCILDAARHIEAARRQLEAFIGRAPDVRL